MGIEHGRVNLSNTSDGKKIPRATFSAATDDFLAEHAYATWNDVLDGHAALLRRYKQLKALQDSHVKATLADMRRFVEGYAAFRALQTATETHTVVVREIDRQFKARHLLGGGDTDSVFGDQAALIYGGGHSSHWKVAARAASNNTYKAEDRLRLAIMYAARYGKSAKAGELADALVTARGGGGGDGLSDRAARLVVKAARYSLPNAEPCKHSACGHYKADEELVSREMQHTPLLSTTLYQISRGKLNEKKFPFVKGHVDAGSGNGRGGEVGRDYREVIVFIVGGVTYEEAKTVAVANAQGNGTRVIVGGTALHNFASFQDEIDACVAAA
eukprot:UC1_evm3s1380